MPEVSTGRPVNRLAGESSPYLLQHAHNPVDWFPWGEEVFAKARTEEKPVFLSIGYSSCHWCHVMEHESFEDAAVAAYLREHFVSVKVDREERPDVDRVYMDAVQAMTGQGGWPLTVFCAPDGRPFFGGTYFPPRDAFGRPSFLRLCEGIAEAWRDRRGELLERADRLLSHLGAAGSGAGSRAGVGAEAAAEGLRPEDPGEAVRTLVERSDPEHGGVGHAPKFPAPTAHELLLVHGRGEEPGASVESARAAFARALEGMRRGGLQDHLGGGFARYSVDERWRVPHFEKMLYDNAQLARLYLHGWQATGEPLWRDVAQTTLGYVGTVLSAPEGGFLTAEDADSEGVEGKFYVWTVEEARAALSPELALLAEARFGITPYGNFEDPHHPEIGSRTVLHLAGTVPELCARFDLAEAEVRSRLEEIRLALLEARERRVRPGLDTKVLTSWNGLALAAFAEAGRVLCAPGHLARALENARFVRGALRNPAGGLFHVWGGGAARVGGLVGDAALYGLGLLELHKATGDLAWLDWAAELWDWARARCWSEEEGLFFSTADDAERLVTRPREHFDGAMPSDNGAAALLGLWLARYGMRPEGERVARKVVETALPLMRRGPSGFGTLWLCAEILLRPPEELVIVGQPELRAPFEEVVAGRFLPFTALLVAGAPADHPLLRGQEGGGVAYLCSGGTCASPARSPEALAALLAGRGAGVAVR